MIAQTAVARDSSSRHRGSGEVRRLPTATRQRGWSASRAERRWRRRRRSILWSGGRGGCWSVEMVSGCGGRLGRQSEAMGRGGLPSNDQFRSSSKSRRRAYLRRIEKTFELSAGAPDSKGYRSVRPPKQRLLASALDTLHRSTTGPRAPLRAPVTSMPKSASAAPVVPPGPACDAGA